MSEEKKYAVLIKILDNLCDEAPKEYQTYHQRDTEEEITTARSKAFIHLLLKVRFGILNFLDREKVITDGTQDGGIDAYYIDKPNKIVYFIQSKFRNNAQIFEDKNMSTDDLLKMEIKNIIIGKGVDSRGNPFNSKIEKFLQEYSSLEHHAAYGYKVIFLGNLHNYSDQQMKKLTDDFDYEVYNFERTYQELVYSLCSGLHYRPEDIFITLNLHNKSHPILEQGINTQEGELDIRITFVPVREIGRVMSQYKNALLQYNPRNYLTLSNNSVNQKIAESILQQKNNNFSILNNGLTIFSKQFKFSGGTGKEGRGQILITNPQIINGGQTAYTLGEIYEKYKDNPDEDPFKEKEVLIKVIAADNFEELNPKFINNISNATNQQTRVDEADRRANEEIQIKLQKLLFDNFGYYYERKKGEFHHGVSMEYISKDTIINRENLLRSYYSSKGFPSSARSSASDTLFSISKFNEILNSTDDFKKMFFYYLAHKSLLRLSKEEWGSGVRYGKYAIVYALSLMCDPNKFKEEEFEIKVKENLNKIKKLWKIFEDEVRVKEENKDYSDKEGGFDFDSYYKGKTLASDIKEFFGNKEAIEAILKN
ncbi:MAG: AIPR family protein [Candidatus Pacearchaeota archaeon]